MHHGLAMEYLAQQRSDEFTRRAEHHNRLTGRGPTRPHGTVRKAAGFVRALLAGRYRARAYR